MPNFAPIMANNVYLASKPRYEILDGLRGVAALLVVLFHCFETYIPQLGTQVINHGYLAVDFFFVLSGFVIGYAYDDRWSFIGHRQIRGYLTANGFAGDTVLNSFHVCERGSSSNVGVVA